MVSQKASLLKHNPLGETHLEGTLEWREWAIVFNLYELRGTQRPN